MSVAYDKGHISVTMLLLCPFFAFESFYFKKDQHSNVESLGLHFIILLQRNAAKY